MIARITFAFGNLLLITAFLVFLATGGESHTTIVTTITGVAILGSLLLVRYPEASNLGISIALASAILTGFVMLQGALAFLTGKLSLIPMVNLGLLIVALGYVVVVTHQLRADLRANEVY